MPRRIALAVSLLAVWTVSAAWAESAESAVQRDFPGWKIHKKAAGDLNGDGLPDFAAILFKEDPKGEDSKAQLVIYLQSAGGEYKRHTAAPDATCIDCGGVKGEPGPLGELTIDNRGVLHVAYEGGSREFWSDELKWRLDKNANEFVLIGETRKVEDTVVPAGQPDHEPTEFTDTNFLTWKQTQRIGPKEKSCAGCPECKPIRLATYNFEAWQGGSGLSKGCEFTCNPGK